MPTRYHGQRLWTGRARALQAERAAMRVPLCTAAALVLLTSAGPAAAQPIPASRPFVVEGHASLFGGPAGLLGAGLDVIPVPGFGVTATVGLGGGGGSAIFGLLPRLRFATGETSAVSVGVGASGGPAFQSGSLAVGDAVYRRDYKRTAFALWLDVVAAWEKDLSERLRLRIYVGAEQRLLTRGKVRCYSQMGRSSEVIEMPCDSPPPFTEPHGPSKFVPVMGGAFGYAFLGRPTLVFPFRRPCYSRSRPCKCPPASARSSRSSPSR